MRAPNYAATVRDQIRAIEQERLRKLAAARAGEKGPHAMGRLRCVPRGGWSHCGQVDIVPLPMRPHPLPRWLLLRLGVGGSACHRYCLSGDAR
jgi:hypothetical protein